MSDQPEDQQQLENQDPENQMPQPLKFINPNLFNLTLLILIIP